MAGQTVAEAVGEQLAREGAQVVFGLMGSGNLVVTNALVAGGARFFAARHENGAVGMADGYARTTGSVGFASVHQGPGLTNTLTALTEAAKARTPLVVLAGETPAAALSSNFRIDQHDLVESVGAAAERVHSAATARADATRAHLRAQRERRPVVLMLPIDIQAQPAPPEDPAAAEARAVVALPPAPNPAALDAVAARLAAAERPVVLGGRGAVVAEAGPALRRLAEQNGALLATSAVAHGLFSGDSYNIGISGGFASPLAAELLPQADLILAFGATLNHWTTRHGALIGPDAEVIHIDLDPAVATVVGDAAATADALLARASDSRPGWRTEALAQRIASERWNDVPFDDAPQPGTIDPRTLSNALAARLPEDVAIAVDSGHFTGWPAMHLHVANARSWLFANAFQAVGLGLGMAIGAAVARGPERVTVAALGDGGTFLSLQELETAARLQLRLLVVVYDDHAYGAEVHHFAPLGVDVAPAQFPPADLAAIAQALGVRGVTVESAADLDAALAGWLGAGAGSGPLLLDAKVDPTIAAAWLEEAFRAG
ncbi:thiamine pyrophosphate-binding protein [Conexibacter woesei]|uniref:thiamine pyrophosphate-binding protein n=1 Tax=Conexibacter woesei TaxID=191495 RepID=UPI00042A656D|nr:thiamine pyrophosphate-dependent enzyme [Conexibacter woesei]